MHPNDRHNTASSQFGSEIRLLPVDSPNPAQQPTSMEPLGAVGSPSYEPYRVEVVGRETWQSKEDAQVPRGWPRVPQNLARRGPFYSIVALTDFLLTLSPLMFIVFGIGALQLDGKPLSEYGSHIANAAKLGPTIFPIIFAAVVGRLMKFCALWRAENGTNLGLLEQLIGSQNLAGAVERMFMLRRFGIIGTAIVLIWALSPLGGQSSLRILDTAKSGVDTLQQLYYFDTNNTDVSMLMGASDLGYFGPTINALYTASLLAPEKVKSSPRDLWSNVKIPMLDELSGDTSEADGNSWISIDSTDNLTYASLTGIMIAGLPTTGTTNFTFESSYLDLTCSDGRDVSTDALNKTLDGKITMHNSSNLFFGTVPTYEGVTGPNSVFIDTITNYSRIMEYRDYPNLLYGSNQGGGSGVWLYNCSIGMTRVEAHATCNDALCAVDKMRRSETDKRSSKINPFQPSSFVNLLYWFPWAAGLPHDAVASPTDLYMQGQNSPFETSTEYQGDFATVSGKVFSQRLSALLNTVWQAALAPTMTAITPSNNLTLYTTSPLDMTHFAAKPTTALTSQPVTIYVSDRLWIGLLLVVTIILQLCAIAGFYLKYTATAPDILGYVSTLTRDNPFTPMVPEGGSNLSGLERARLLSNLPVQIGDVNWEEDKGHIAFRSVGTAGEFRPGHVTKKREYF